MEERGGIFHWNSSAGGKPVGKKGRRHERPRGRGACSTIKSPNGMCEIKLGE
jgi:hypothetical protein